MTSEPVRYTVPVDGGELAVARWGDATPVVIAAHGITASHLAWSTVADELDGGLTLLAPDLRGRGDSATLPGPYGMARHSRDLAAVLDHAEVGRAVVVGHSMGGLVALAFANQHPERSRAAVLVDVPPVGAPPPDDVDVDAVLAAVIGPAVARLEQRFASPDEYRRFWRDHPALRDSDVDPARIDAYADHDLHGDAGELRSKVSADAVRADARDALLNDDVRRAMVRLSVPAVLLVAERGMLDGPVPLNPDEALADLVTARGPLEVIRVPDTNHYTITLGPAGARAVARLIRRFALAEEAA